MSIRDYSKNVGQVSAAGRNVTTAYAQYALTVVAGLGKFL